MSWLEGSSLLLQRSSEAFLTRGWLPPFFELSQPLGLRKTEKQYMRGLPLVQQGSELTQPCQLLAVWAVWSLADVYPGCMHWYGSRVWQHEYCECWEESLQALEGRKYRVSANITSLALGVSDLGMDSNAREVAQNSRASLCVCVSKYASLYWISLPKTLDFFGFVSWPQQCCGVNPSSGFRSYPWGLVCREFLLQWSAQGP